jgi:serine/threonine protein kinase
MGSVWVAHHARLKADVVVKLLSDAHLDDDAIRARFEREVAAAAQVRSPHVVQTLDHGVTEDGVPFIVLELLEGEDLAQTLATRGRLELDEAMLVLESLGSALTKAHELGIVHRDIKPANVFLCSGGKSWHVKLVDFGIAKMAREPNLSMSGEMVGTPAYMAPEALEGSRDLDHRADIWSLGVLGYHMIVGRAPFRAESVGQVALAIFTNNYVAPSKVWNDLPYAVDAWFARACMQEPSARFASARELADAFAEAIRTPKRDVATAVMSQPPTFSPPKGVNLVTGPPEPGIVTRVSSTRVSSTPPPPSVPMAETMAMPMPMPMPIQQPPPVPIMAPRASMSSTPPPASSPSIVDLTLRPFVDASQPGGIAVHRGLIVLVAAALATLLVAGLALRSTGPSSPAGDTTAGEMPVSPEPPATIATTAPAVTTVTAPTAIIAAPAIATATAAAEPAIAAPAIAPATAPATASTPATARTSTKRPATGRPPRRPPGAPRGNGRPDEEDVGF